MCQMDWGHYIEMMDQYILGNLQMEKHREKDFMV